MMHLIKLELKKGRMSGAIWGSLLAYGLIAGFLILLYFTEGRNQTEPAFQDFGELLQAADIMVRATFIIYASALLSRLVINEYKDKTIHLLFAYPVKRSKLITAKLALVFVWTFANVVIGNLLVDALMSAIESRFHYIGGGWTSGMIGTHGLEVVLQAIGAAGMGLLPLVAGMRWKSVPATITSSIIIVMIVCSNNLGFSLSSIIAIPLTLAAIGLLVTYLTFRNIDLADVE